MTENNLLLAEEDFDRLQKEQPDLDWSFQDDYRNEVRFIEEAQLAKVLNAGYLSPEEVGAKIEEAKKQERERIIKEIEAHNIYEDKEDEYLMAVPNDWWQALKSKGDGELNG